MGDREKVVSDRKRPNMRGRGKRSGFREGGRLRRRERKAVYCIIEEIQFTPNDKSYDELKGPSSELGKWNLRKNDSRPHDK